MALPAPPHGASKVDLLVRNANLVDGREGVDIAATGGRIVAIKRGIAAEAGQPLDATGRLVSPPFVDPHFHMDATLSLRLPRLNRSGMLFKGIALRGELKPMLTVEAVVERALKDCEIAIGQGLLAIRSHVDVCDDRLIAVDALLEVRRRVAPVIDLQLVAFPQDGLYRSPKAEANLIAALDRGDDVIGDVPHFERTMEDGAASVRALTRLAAERGRRVDLHCDETDDPLSRHVETLASETVRHGLHGRVAGSHLTSMHSMDNDGVSKLIPLMAEAELHAIPNPGINITLQGRHDTCPKPRSMTRVPDLMAAGVNVAFGQDCMMDPWYSLGNANMLDVVHMAIHVAQMTSIDAMRAAYGAITVNSATAMGLEGYGVAVGCKADFVVLQAKETFEAIRTRATRLKVVKGGRVVAETEGEEGQGHDQTTFRLTPCPWPR